jgi:hypothetical protein
MGEEKGRKGKEGKTPKRAETGVKRKFAGEKEWCAIQGSNL